MDGAQWERLISAPPGWGPLEVAPCLGLQASSLTHQWLPLASGF